MAMPEPYVQGLQSLDNPVIVGNMGSDAMLGNHKTKVVTKWHKVGQNLCMAGPGLGYTHTSMVKPKGNIFLLHTDLFIIPCTCKDVFGGGVPLDGTASSQVTIEHYLGVLHVLSQTSIRNLPNSNLRSKKGYKDWVKRYHFNFINLVLKMSFQVV